MTMKNVLLINPCFDRERQYGKFQDLVKPNMPISLGLLAGYLEARGVNVRVVDEFYDDLSEENLRRIIEESASGIVGISCVTPMIYRGWEIAKSAKKINPDIHTILGGVHPSIFPDESLEQEAVDVAVRLEGELTLWELVQAFSQNKSIEDIQGISFRRNGTVVHNPDRPFVKDLDSFPLFPFHLFDADPPRYNFDALLSSRGCPWKCIFCSARHITGHRYRTMSAERIMQEAEILIHKYDAKSLYFIDDNFCVDKKRVLRFCDLYMEKGYHKNINWNCLTRINLVDEPFLRKIKEAGCRSVSFGIETASERLLELINKKTSIDKIVKAVHMARDAGLMVRGSFILGLPTETREDSLATIKFAKSLPLDAAKFSIATPFPGTVFYEMAIKEGFNISGDWSQLSTVAGLGENEPIYIPKGRTAQELKKLQRRAHLEFYMRPRHILAILRGKNLGFQGVMKLTSVKEIGRYAKIFASFVKDQFKPSTVK